MPDADAYTDWPASSFPIPTGGRNTHPPVVTGGEEFAGGNNQDGGNVAIIVGGAETVIADVERARELCRAVGARPVYLVINDMIAHFPDACLAVSLHPDKLPGWLAKRNGAGYPAPAAVWSHRTQRGVVTNFTRDWGGSTGLLAAKIAIQEMRIYHVLLCGVPMTVEANHFLRKTRWNACSAFWRAWITHREDLRPFVRSFSGQTADLLGRPSIEFLRHKQAVAS